MATLQSRTLTVRIERPLDEVYDFLAQPRNFARWAAGLDLDLDIAFTERNRFGIADHTVRTPEGEEVYVPLRAIRNGSGAEVLFTLLRTPEMTDQLFARDAAAVEQDLATLKRVLEAGD